MKLNIERWLLIAFMVLWSALCLVVLTNYRGWLDRGAPAAPDRAIWRGLARVEVGPPVWRI